MNATFIIEVTDFIGRVKGVCESCSTWLSPRVPLDPSQGKIRQTLPYRDPGSVTHRLEPLLLHINQRHIGAAHSHNWLLQEI